MFNKKHFHALEPIKITKAIFNYYSEHENLINNRSKINNNIFVHSGNIDNNQDLTFITENLPILIREFNNKDFQKHDKILFNDDGENCFYTDKEHVDFNGHIINNCEHTLEKNNINESKNNQNKLLQQSMLNQEDSKEKQKANLNDFNLVTSNVINEKMNYMHLNYTENLNVINEDNPLSDDLRFTPKEILHDSKKSQNKINLNNNEGNNNNNIKTIEHLLETHDYEDNKQEHEKHEETLEDYYNKIKSKYIDEEEEVNKNMNKSLNQFEISPLVTMKVSQSIEMKNKGGDEQMNHKTDQNQMKNDNDNNKSLESLNMSSKVNIYASHAKVNEVNNNSQHNSNENMQNQEKKGFNFSLDDFEPRDKKKTQELIDSKYEISSFIVKNNDNTIGNINISNLENRILTASNFASPIKRVSFIEENSNHLYNYPKENIDNVNINKIEKDVPEQKKEKDHSSSIRTYSNLLTSKPFKDSNEENKECDYERTNLAIQSLKENNSSKKCIDPSVNNINLLTAPKMRMSDNHFLLTEKQDDGAIKTENGEELVSISSSEIVTDINKNSHELKKIITKRSSKKVLTLKNLKDSGDDQKPNFYAPITDLTQTEQEAEQNHEYNIFLEHEQEPKHQPYLYAGSPMNKKEDSYLEHHDHNNSCLQFNSSYFKHENERAEQFMPKNRIPNTAAIKKTGLTLDSFNKNLVDSFYMSSDRVNENNNNNNTQKDNESKLKYKDDRKFDSNEAKKCMLYNNIKNFNQSFIKDKEKAEATTSFDNRSQCLKFFYEMKLNYLYLVIIKLFSKRVDFIQIWDLKEKYKLVNSQNKATKKVCQSNHKLFNFTLKK